MANTRTGSHILVALIVLLGLVVAVIVFRPPRQYDIRIVTPPSIIASLPHWIAEEQGLYERNLLRVETIDVQSSPLMVEALINHDADILPAVSLPDLINRASSFREVPLIFSHSRMLRDPAFESLIVLRDGPIGTLRDIPASARVAVYPGVTSEALVAAFLEDNSLDTSTFTFNPLPPPEHLPALDRGDVDVVHLYEPFRSQALTSQRYRELSGGLYPWLAEPSAIGVSAVSQNFLAEDEEAAEAFFRVWNEAIEFIADNPESARRILADRLGISEQTAQAATWVDATGTDETDRDTIIRTALRLQEIGLIPDSVDIVDIVRVPQ